MIQFRFIAICLIALLPLAGRSQSFLELAEKSSGSSGTAMTAGSDGNIYITGVYYKKLSLGNASVSGKGKEADVFIASYSPGGSLRWLKSFSGEGTDMPFSILWKNESLYVTGKFSGEAEIDGHKAVSKAASDLFLISMDASGNVKKLISGSGSGDVWGWNLASGPGESILLSGGFEKDIQLGNHSVDGAMERNIFLARLNADGSVRWLTQATGGKDYKTGVWPVAAASLSGDRVAWIGRFAGSADFKGHAFTSMQEKVSGADVYHEQMFIATYDGEGNFIDLKIAGTGIIPEAVASGPDSSLYIAGWFSGLREGPLKGTAMLPGKNVKATPFKFSQTEPSEDAFLMKWKDGEVKWFTPAGGSSADRALGLDVRGDEILVTGFFGATSKWGDIMMTTTGEKEYKFDIFIAAYDQDGKIKTVISGGGLENDKGNAILVLDEAIFVAGDCRDEVKIGDQSGSAGKDDTFFLLRW